jgi:mannose-6-phosphate isomerase-like protein (cupin superfamily)
MNTPTLPTPISLERSAAALPDLWSPRILGQVNDQFLKVARVHGDFPWHVHDDEDELFLVLRGALTIGRAEVDGGPVCVQAGEVFIVPRGMRHNTSAAEETLIALIETVTTRHTGSDVTPQTRSIDDQMAPTAR